LNVKKTIGNHSIVVRISRLLPDTADEITTAPAGRVFKHTT
jgi:hypothetical protein